MEENRDRKQEDGKSEKTRKRHFFQHKFVESERKRQEDIEEGGRERKRVK